MYGRDHELGCAIDKAPWLFPLKQMTRMDVSLASEMRKAPGWQYSKDVAKSVSV